ncbi:MAG: enoyl-CoA hydratase/isomerase family protein [Burkholderiales bacterium]|nr:enoyl-CoA hydratase/isomerase family protein [Burkholderiales bacterium]
MSESILFDVAGGVATITFNRPRVLNALDAAMIRALRAACEAIERDATARAVLVRGAGPGFLAGGDVGCLRANIERAPAFVRELAGELHEALLALRRAAKPVVAGVHGAVAGAGLSVMAAADLAIAADDACFTLAYGAIGASPDGGATWTLPRIVGERRALELMLLGDAIDARAALALGLVNRVVAAAELGAECERVARRLARGPTRAFAETKRLVHEGAARTLEDQLHAEVNAFARCAATVDFAEGVSAFVEKRSPEFRGR